MSAVPPPRIPGTNPWLWLLLIAAAWTLLMTLWVAGIVGALIIGAGWRIPSLLGVFLTNLLQGHPQQAWPGLSGLSYVLSVLLVGTPVAVGATFLGRRLLPRRPAVPGLAGAEQLAAFHPAALAERVAALRPSLTGQTNIEAREAGVPLGRLDGAGDVAASWEDTVLAVMGPRAGKTTGLTIPIVLDAPGPVLATSNKPDLWAATSVLRANLGAVWTFDPQQIVPAPQSWWWNPIADVASVEDASRLAGHFLAEVAEPGKRDFWSGAAEELLTDLIMAAALKHGTLQDVRAWLTDQRSPEPRKVLEEGGAIALADSLAGLLGGHDETREGIYQTARTATKALRDDSIMAWVVPGPGQAFSSASFVRSTDTLYLLSKDGAGSAAPLVAALADRIFRAATRAAEQAGGRLDPPLVGPLDEAANICRIADLPELYSHLGSRGIIPVTILQSYKQGMRVWGEHGMDALWSAATVKLVGAGVDDAAFVANISRLIGDHDVPVTTWTRGRGSVTDSTTSRRQPVMGPEDIRALPRGSALLFVSGAKPALLHLVPWYDGPNRDAIQAALERAQRQQRGWTPAPPVEDTASGATVFEAVSLDDTPASSDEAPDVASSRSSAAHMAVSGDWAAKTASLPLPTSLMKVASPSALPQDPPKKDSYRGIFCLVGREPVARDDEPEPELNVINDPTLTVSKTHLAFGVDEHGLWFMDRNSTNGTWSRPESGEPVRHPPWRRIYVPTGSILLELGYERVLIVDGKQHEQSVALPASTGQGSVIWPPK